MATFTSFSDLLPDPNNKINNAGVADTSGTAGPGFAKVKFTSDNTTQVSRTISGRGVTASPSYHHWMFDISYNPMTRSEFDPIGSFLESRRGRLNPFYVILPQHASPRDQAFYTWINPSAGNHSITASATSAGSPSIMINGCDPTPVSGVYSGPLPGDFFTITDSADSNHKKAYKVLRVEDNSTYQAGTTVPTTVQRRIWTQPPISRAVSSGAVLNFINPKFRVIQKGDTLEYDLDTNNLYQFSLSLEEMLP